MWEVSSVWRKHQRTCWQQYVLMSIRHTRHRQTKPVCLGNDYELPGNTGIWGDGKQMDNCEEGKLYAPGPHHLPHHLSLCSSHVDFLAVPEHCLASVSSGPLHRCCVSSASKVSSFSLTSFKSLIKWDFLVAICNPLSLCTIEICAP